MREWLDDYIAAFEGLKATDLSALDRVMAPGVQFIDPFNNVTGVNRVKGIFAHMYREIPDARFVVRNSGLSAEADDTGFLHWELSGTTGKRRRELSIVGMSLVRSQDGMIVEHVDHWDASQQFYETLPVLGWLLKCIRRKIGLPESTL